MVARTIALLTCFLLSDFARSGEITDTRNSPFAKLHGVRLDEVTWTGGFWADRFATVRDHSVPSMWKLMKGNEYKPFYQHFLIAAGKMNGDYHGAAWNDGDFYKWIEAACAVFAVTHDTQLKQNIDLAIAAIADAQADDGYIHTPILIRQRNGDKSAKPFGDRFAFEMYNMGHLMTAACLHQRVTGEDNFLAVARKTADFLITHFKTPTPELAKNSVCPSHYMGALSMYRTTRDKRYLELAKTFINMRSLVTEGNDDNQDRIPFVDQSQAVGHAVRANYLYSGVADLYLETGDETLKAPLEKIWENVTSRKMYITGACGALFDGASPDGSKDQKSISRVHQAYGRNYQLPHVTAHSETCANIGNLLWNWRMFLATGEARYFDIVELTLYNSILSGVSLDGTNYFYVNPMRQTEALPTELRWSRTRVPFFVSFCCPPNVVRTLAEVSGYAYSKTDDSIWVNLYGSSRLTTRLRDQPVEIVQTTNYPWDGKVKLRFDACPSRPIRLRFRIPGWAEKATVTINNKPGEQAILPGSYFELNRRWAAGDNVTLTLPMPTRLMEAHPLVEEARNQVAIQRGPVVYCVESHDLPVDIRLEDVVIPDDASFATEFRRDFLGGVAELQCQAMVRSPSDWSNRLYQPRKQAPLKSFPLRLIPYYAWANRGKSEMSVWMPILISR